MPPFPRLVPLLILGARTLAAQGDVTLGLGAGTVRYTGGASFSTASVSPAAQFESPTLTAAGSASLASLPQGVWSTQGRGDVWAASAPFAARLQLAGEVLAAGTTRGDGGWSAAAHGIGEVLWAAPRWGVALGAGPSAGWIESTPSVTALHLRARGWWQTGPTIAAVASVEPTWFLGAWFTDVTTGLTVTRGRVTASFWTQARLSAAYGSTAAGNALLQAFLTPAIAIELGGGSYLRDPYQGLPRTGYGTLGVRLHARPPITRPPARWAPLIPTPRGDTLIVRFRLSGARTVAIAGDWNAWQPAPLRAMGGDLWEGVVTMRSGLYHFNLLVDGTEWVVPHGVATVSDGLGGLVGVLTVP